MWQPVADFHTGRIKKLQLLCFIVFILMHQNVWLMSWIGFLNVCLLTFLQWIIPGENHEVSENPFFFYPPTLRWSQWSWLTSCSWRRVKATVLLEWSRQPTVRASRTSSSPRRRCFFWGMTAFENSVLQSKHRNVLFQPVVHKWTRSVVLPWASHLNKGVSWRGY